MNTQIIKFGYVNFSGRMFSIDVVKSKAQYQRWIMANYNAKVKFEPETEFCRKKEIIYSGYFRL